MTSFLPAVLIYGGISRWCKYISIGGSFPLTDNLSVSYPENKTAGRSNFSKRNLPAVITLCKCKLYFIYSGYRNLLDFLTCVFPLQGKNHVIGTGKKTYILFPAHTTFAVLYPYKLLFHFSTAIWADFITFSHAVPFSKEPMVSKCCLYKVVKSSSRYLTAMSGSAAMSLHFKFPLPRFY